MGLLTLTPLKGSAVPFNPNQISGLTLYLDPRLGVTKNGSNQVTAWVDQSVNANVANPYPVNPTNAFIFTSNEFGTQPGLLGDGLTTLMMLSSSITGLSAFTLFVIFKPTNAPGSPQYLLVQGTSTGADVIGLFNNPATQVSDTTGNFANFSAGVSAGTSTLFQMQSDTGPASSVLTMNGVVQTLAASGGTSWAAGIDLIGGDFRGTPFRPADGAFGPIIAYNRSLSDPECSLVSTWLQNDGWY